MFYLDPGCIEDNLIDKGAWYFHKIDLKCIPGGGDKYCCLLHVPVGCAKFKSQVQLELDTPIMAYYQHDQNSCCFISLASALKASTKFDAANSIATRISA